MHMEVRIEGREVGIGYCKVSNLQERQDLERPSRNCQVPSPGTLPLPGHLDLTP